MAEKKDFEALNNLFQHGLTMSALPVGYAAGTGARILDLPSDLGVIAIDELSGKNWRGKYFQ